MAIIIHKRETSFALFFRPRNRWIYYGIRRIHLIRAVLRNCEHSTSASRDIDVFPSRRPGQWCAHIFISRG